MDGGSLAADPFWRALVKVGHWQFVKCGSAARASFGDFLRAGQLIRYWHHVLRLSQSHSPRTVQLQHTNNKIYNLEVPQPLKFICPRRMSNQNDLPHSFSILKSGKLNIELSKYQFTFTLFQTLTQRKQWEKWEKKLPTILLYNETSLYSNSEQTTANKFKLYIS